jgi:hypothetical protein
VSCAAEAIERIKIQVGAAAVQRGSRGVAGAGRAESARRRQRLETACARPGSTAGVPEPVDVKWTEAEVEEFRQGRLPVTKFTDPNGSSATSKKVSRRRRSSSTKHS